MEQISRRDAHILGLLHFYTGKPCKHGHISSRYVSTGNCIACQQDKNNTFKRVLNPWTAELGAFVPPSLLAPAALTREQRISLRWYLQRCIFQWVYEQGLQTVSLTKAREEIEARPPNPQDPRVTG